MAIIPNEFGGLCEAGIAVISYIFLVVRIFYPENAPLMYNKKIATEKNGMLIKRSLNLSFHGAFVPFT